MKTAYRVLLEGLTVMAVLAWTAVPAAGAEPGAAVAPAPLSAANPPPVTRLITLGTQGGPRINSTRAQPANVLIVRGTPYLIDAGNGVGRQLALAKVPITRIGRIFITHNHDDHNADWGALMGIAWSLGRKEPIHVYGPRGTESMLLGFLQYFAPNVANRTFHSAGATPPASVFFAHDTDSIRISITYPDPDATKALRLEAFASGFSKGGKATTSEEISLLLQKDLFPTTGEHTVTLQPCNKRVTKDSTSQEKNDACGSSPSQSVKIHL